MNLPRRLHTAPILPALTRITKAARGESPEAILVYPGEDLQGDIIEPDGGNWKPFEANGRLVNFEHGPHIGTGRVEMKCIEHDGEEVNVPVGVSTFFTKSADLKGLTLAKYDARGNAIGRYSADECLRYADQVGPLVLNGTLDGVSIEFRPSGPEGVAYKSLGPNAYLDGRNACHFQKWDGLGWAAACRQPVNNNARYVLPDDVLARAEKAFRALENPSTLTLIRKSLSPLAAILESRRKVVPVNTRRLVKAGAYPDEDDDPTDADDLGGDGPGETPDMPADPVPGAGGPKDAVDLVDDLMPDDGAMDGQAEPPPSVAAAIDGAQAAKDGLQAINDGFDDAIAKLKMSDNPSARNKIKGLLEEARKEITSVANKYAVKIQKVGDALAAKLASDDESPVADADEPADTADVDADESGMVMSKAFPSYIPEPRRHRKSDLKPPVKRKPKPKPVAVAAGEIDLDKIAELERQLGLA